jgi:hypothetical protein
MISSTGAAWPAMLLLDLDGVVVFEHGPPWLERREIIRLHDELATLLRRLGAQLVVLTHRSRAEASRVLQAADIPRHMLADVMAAEDLFVAGLRHGGLCKMLRHGLLKSLVLPELEARHGIPRGDMIFVDDRLDNLQDLLAHGLGLALHAPSAVTADGGLVTFDAADILMIVNGWLADRSGPALRTLPPRSLAIGACGRTGLCTTREAAHHFNLLRTVARKLRRGLQSMSRVVRFAGKTGRAPPAIPDH